MEFIVCYFAIGAVICAIHTVGFWYDNRDYELVFNPSGLFIGIVLWPMVVASWIINLFKR